MTKEELLQYVDESYERIKDVLDDKEKAMGRMVQLQMDMQNAAKMPNKGDKIANELLDITLLTLVASKQN